ncbi:hypothetical protein GLOIN_2v1581448 [Rhizophagus clarus]|uniref:Uncharacterized protein n=1 Tax=Rhizophagus clarus TaxID=94130 RepID=A0A8H3LP49_9GLOM|nr:hypothetical protein GLOIN_2v1581448 [Rhizophagus clarus]
MKYTNNGNDEAMKEFRNEIMNLIEDIKNEAISQLPEEPKMTCEETVEEYNNRVEVYEEKLKECNFLLRGLKISVQKFSNF